MEILRVENLTKIYGKGDVKVAALDHVSFSVHKGEFVAIIGASGSGKSTLLHLMGGVDRPTEGKVFIEDKDVFALNDDQLAIFRRRQIGLIYQFYNLIPNLTAKENVELMEDITDLKIDGDRILESVGLTGHGNQFPAQLSGGEQQRVSIARALAKEPAMLLCDEPTGALDSNTGVLILSLLQDMCHKKNTTVIIVTHNSKLADAADKLIRIKNGQIEEVTIKENPLDVNLIEW